MKKASKRKTKDDLRPEYVLSKLKDGVRGKYASIRIVSDFGFWVAATPSQINPCLK